MSQLSQFDPSAPKMHENMTSYAKTEEEVTLAYGVALRELDVLTKMVNEVEQPPKTNDLEALKRFRATVTQDIRRLGMRLDLSKSYLKARDEQFHYFAKRLRTTNRVDRLRLWEREENKELEAVRLQSGDQGYALALQRFEEKKRVIIRCYGLEDLWEKAMRAEMSVQVEGDDLSSGCDTSSEE